MSKAQTENQKKLLKILNEIFQLDQSDLDFGIYRIMNTKSKEIQEFLDNDLLSSVAKAFSSNDNSALQKELDELVKTLTNAGMNAEDSPKVQELKNSLSSSSTSSNLENDVFSHLANFFKRYYKDGDFVSLRRYKKDTYAIPYEGEEVKLHWANSDQYYIKSGEYFRDYTFTVNDKTIHLKLSDAQTETNNNKATSDKERRFVYLGCEVLTPPKELHINFEYKAVGKESQDKLNEEAIKQALQNIEELEFLNALNTLAPTEKNPKRTLFEKHLKSYTSRNSFDYFIHKDLGGFLSRELDFYIKNEMLFLDDIMESPIKYEEVMNKVKIFKTVSQKIIAFLTQIEELQKKLWEKKKFVIETNYCITLDKIPQKYHEEIFACATQLAEWKILLGSEVLTSHKGGAKAPLPDELKYLVLDTKFFDTKFKYSLLSEFDNLDETIDGVLINSENFGALSLLQERYKEQVKCVYIDPPYNTGGDDFIYKDNYQHSSWLSMLNNRLEVGSKFIKSSGQFSISIDLKEQDKTITLLDNLWGEDNRKNFITIKRGSVTGAKVINPGVVNISEYVLTYSVNTKEWQPERAYRQKIYDNRYGSIIVNPDEHYSMWKFQSVLDGFSEYKGLSKSKLKKELGDNYDDELSKFVIDNAKNVIRLASLDEKSVSQEAVNLKRKSLREKDKIQYLERPEKNDYYILNGNIILFYKDRLQLIGEQLVASEPISDIWDDVLPNDLHNEGGVSLRKGKKPEKLLHRILEMSSRENELVLDYFAGSGTTCAVAQKSHRKWLGIEQGIYFDTITLVRMKNTLYGDSSGITDITGWKGGGFFKYFKLESYEDTLNNLEFTRTKAQEDTLNLFPHAKEDYLLNYSLHAEAQGSLLNIDTFSTPFDYKLKIATSSVGETKETTVDLVETFNYLLGLVVKRIELLKDYLVVEGQNLKKEKILIIWRDGQSSDELNEFFKKMDWSVYDREFDTIYVNGDNNLDNLRKDEDHFKVKLIEQEFKRLMFHE